MQTPPTSLLTGQVRLRCVFYLSGFDPKGAAHYHALYRDEAARQALVSGMSVEVGRRQKTAESNAFWQVTAHNLEGPEVPADPVETRYEFLRWDDIVREHWPRNPARLRWDIVTTAWLNLRHGALWRMLKLAWPPVVALFSPFVLLLAMLAKALRLDPQLGTRGPVVSFLTLGQWMPLLGCLPQAQAFRDDLQVLATAQGIDWIDFTAPPDGCCFALVDPIAACGINDAARQEDRPKLLSPRFAEMFELSDYAAIRRDKFRIHFQYLMASSKPVSYDYFAITAGNTTLAKRFNKQPGINDYKGLKLIKYGNKQPTKKS